MFELRAHPAKGDDLVSSKRCCHRFSYHPEARFLDLVSPVITNLCTQSQRFFLESDTLFRSGLGGFAKSHASVMRLNANGKKPHCLRELV